MVSEKKRIVLFFIITFVITYTISLFMWINGIGVKSENFDLYTTILMFIPLLTAVFTIIMTKDKFRALGLLIKLKKSFGKR